jgi:hypothetical protein
VFCYEVANALEEGAGLDELRPRPLPKDLEPTREDLNRVLTDIDWRGLPGSGRGTIPTVIRLYDLIDRVIRRGHTLGLAWGAILELIEANAAELSVRPRKNASWVDLDAGEGMPILQMLPEKIEAFRKARDPIQKPSWDRGTGRLSYGPILCKHFKRFAPVQYAILDEFHAEKWARSVKVPRRMSRQTVQDLNDKLSPDCRIRFGYSESTGMVSWKLNY